MSCLPRHMLVAGLGGGAAKTLATGSPPVVPELST